MQFIHYGWYRVAASMSCCALLSCAQTALAEEPAPGADAVVVSATRRDQPSLLLPAAVDRLYSDEIRFGRPQIPSTASSAPTAPSPRSTSSITPATNSAC